MSALRPSIYEKMLQVPANVRLGLSAANGQAAPGAGTGLSLRLRKLQRGQVKAAVQTRLELIPNAALRTKVSNAQEADFAKQCE